MRLRAVRAILPRLPRLRRGPSRKERAALDSEFVGYAPRRNGQADPGEVVWAWVPFQEDPSKGKDRPVLVLSRHGDELLTLALTSKDHDPDLQQESRVGRHWMDVGTGAWDRRRRPSEVRLDRLVILRDADVRREGAALDRAIFYRVVEAARAFHPI
jgi:hypothetical protein